MTGSGSLFSLVFGTAWGPGARLAAGAAGGLPTAKMAGSTKAVLGAAWVTAGTAAGMTGGAIGGAGAEIFNGGTVGTSERSTMFAAGMVIRGFHSLLLSSQTV